MAFFLSAGTGGLNPVSQVNLPLLVHGIQVDFLRWLNPAVQAVYGWLNQVP